MYKKYIRMCYISTNKLVFNYLLNIYIYRFGNKIKIIIWSSKFGFQIVFIRKVRKIIILNEYKQMGALKKYYQPKLSTRLGMFMVKIATYFFCTGKWETWILINFFWLCCETVLHSKIYL